MNPFFYLFLVHYKRRHSSASSDWYTAHVTAYQPPVQGHPDWSTPYSMKPPLIIHLDVPAVSNRFKCSKHFSISVFLLPWSRHVAHRQAPMSSPHLVFLLFPAQQKLRTKEYFRARTITIFLCCCFLSILFLSASHVNSYTHSLCETFFYLRELIQMPHFSDEYAESQRDDFPKVPQLVCSKSLKLA